MNRALLLMPALLFACETATPPSGINAVTREATTGEPSLSATPDPGVARFTAPHYTIDAVPPDGGCVVSASCEVRLELFAKAGFKVNFDYPAKFVPVDEPGIKYEAPARMIASGKHVGVLPVRLVAQNAAIARVRGEMKIGVCDDSKCENETVEIELDVPLKPVT